MKKNNFLSSKNFLFAIPFLILLIGLPLIDAFVLNPAPSITTPTIPTTILNFRDNMNTANSTATVSFSSSTLTLGSNEITVTHQDANVDLISQDSILVSVNSTTSNPAEAVVTLLETGVDTGVFTGNVILSSSTTTGNTVQASVGDSISTIYVPFPFTSPTAAVASGDDLGYPTGRLSASVGIASGSGDIILTDFLIINQAQIDCTFTLVINPIQIDLPSGVTTNSFSVTMSYANSNLQASIPTQLRMLYSPIPANPTDTLFFTSLTPPGPPPSGLDLSGHDFFNFKITGITAPPNVEGLYAIGFFDNGCSGGGGGGLVRPGLVVNALAGLSAAAGGGGGGPPGPTVTLGALALYDSAVETISMPQEIRDIALNHNPYTPLEPITDIYEDFDLPLSINGNGFVLGDYENTLETQTIEPGKPTEFVIVYYTNSEIAHSSLNFNLGPTRTIQGSDTQVLLYKDKPAEVIDPNGNIASATGSINNEGDLKRVATFSITFSESAELPNPDIVIRSWSDNLSSGDTIVYDAIKIAQPEIVVIADEDLPEPEIQTLKSQYVPIWIKNNAAWWSQELIDDSDFISGIEYLIQQEIILISDNGEVTNTSNEIPSWIKNNAGWWSDNLITEKEFIDGLQWLISNGIIQVTET